MQKIILFDFDGTLADSFKPTIEIINALAAKYKFTPITSQNMERLRGESAANLFKILRVPLIKLPFLARDTKMMQKEQIADIDPIEGIIEALLELKKSGYILGILTSNGEENVKAFLQKNNLDMFTYFSFDSSLFGKDKMLKNFMQKNRLKHDQVIYVGDEIRDLEASIRAGITMIAVTWGFNSKEGLLKYQPKYLIDKPAELAIAVSRVSPSEHI